MKKYSFLLLLILSGAVTAFGSPPGISIANARIVEGNGGQRSVEVMVLLSPFASSPSNLTYLTRNGSATAGSDYAAVNGTVSFGKGETQKKIQVPINGDLAVEANETFEIILRNATGSSILDSIGIVTIINDDINSGPAVYEVRLTHTGYTSFTDSPDKCPIRPDGKVVLTGLLFGAENVRADDDIMYTGVLDLVIDMDICSIKPGPRGDDNTNCGMTVLAFGPVNAELEIYFDQRGGYSKFKSTPGDVTKLVYGSCDPAQQSEEEIKLVPDKTIAAIFNGRDLPMLTNRTLQVGRYEERDGENVTVVEVLRKIR